MTAANGRFKNGSVLVEGADSQLEFRDLFLGSADGVNDVGGVTFEMENLTPANNAAIVYVGDDRAPFAGSGSAVHVSDSGSRGNLVVRNGSSLTSDYGHIGFGSGTAGEITITGAGSRWTTRLNNFIGTDGQGTLNILDGGSVQNAIT